MRELADLRATTFDTSPLHPVGPVGNHIDTVYTALFWASVAVFSLVAVAIVYAALRFRRRHEGEEEPAQVHGNSRVEVAWTLVPAAILVSLFGLTAANMPFITSAPAGALHVCVEGQQFTWNYYYEEGCGPGVLTASGRRSYRPSDPTVPRSSIQLYVPVGRPVALEVVSDDVNHSFYVPRLGGQINAIPGQYNHMWIQADAPGDYLGQCLELCGSGHANMELDVVGVPTSRWPTCLAELRKSPPYPACAAGGQ